MKNISRILLLSAILFHACNDTGKEFDATGTFQADEIIISASGSGTIEQFDVEEGATVEEGQLLGWIDTTQLHLRKKQLIAQIDAILSKRPSIATQLASHRVQVENAQRELQRARNLFQAEAATQKQVDDAAAQLAVIRRQMEAHRSSLDISASSLLSETLPLSAQVEQIDDQIRQCRIVNPVAGVVLQQYAEQHELANPGKPLYKVADLSVMELRAYITGSQLSTIKVGDEVTVLTDDGRGGFNEYRGTIAWISHKAEFTPKTIQTKEERAHLVYAIHVRVKNDGYLKIGMYGEVKF